MLDKMKFTKEYLKRFFEQEGHPYLIFEGGLTGGLPDMDFSDNYLSLFIATQGQITFSSRGQQVTAGTSCIQMFLKDASLEVSHVSDDYRSIGVIFSKEYWRDNLLLVYPYLNFAVMEPSLEVTRVQIDSVMDYLHAIQQLNASGYRPDSDVIRSVFEGLFSRIGELYHRRLSSYRSSNQCTTFVGFCELLFKNYKKERSVSFYADRLGVTLAVLSTRIKGAVGYSPLTCISHYISVKLCQELRNTDKTIKELAIEYNFSDSSHLCKFFKANVGDTPETYRTRYLGIE